MTEKQQAAIVNTVVRRLIWLFFLLYFCGVVDRNNVGFAALTMNKEIGLTGEAFGFGAGLFFIGYMLFEIPSNLILHRVGARRWLAFIAIVWGITSTGNMFVAGPVSFFICRFFMGAAEAGLLPGLLLASSYWFPMGYRGRVTAGFMIASPLTSVVASPLSGFILGLDGKFGLPGWQWLFLLEGMPAVVVGVFTLFYLPDRPASAAWLEPEERKWLQDTLDDEQCQRERHYRLNVWQALVNPAVLLLGIADIGPKIAQGGGNFWLPQIVATIGLSHVEIGLISALPYVAGVAAALFWGRQADRSGKPFRWTAGAAALSAFGWGLGIFVDSPVLMVIALILAFAGSTATVCLFWSLPGRLLSGAALAAGIPMAGAIGDLGGVGGPYVTGALRHAMGNFHGTFIFYGVSMLLTSLVILWVGLRMARESRPAKVLGVLEPM